MNWRDVGGEMGRKMEENEFISKVQRRIANISIGPSTLRGQPKDTARIVRKFLEELNLNNFSNIPSESEFLNKLEKNTSLLQDLIPSKSWGIARKALNIFLFQSVHDIFLCEKYNLRKLIPFLELTLDNPNAKKLIDRANQRGINLNWKNIKSLNKEDSTKLQEFAKKIAREEFNCERGHLDIYFWRDEG